MIAVSGDKYVDLAPREYVEVGFARVSTYQTIEIDPESHRLTYRAWTEDARTIDELTIEKAAADGSRRPGKRFVGQALRLSEEPQPLRSLENAGLLGTSVIPRCHRARRRKKSSQSLPVSLVSPAKAESIADFCG